MIKYAAISNGKVLLCSDQVMEGSFEDYTVRLTSAMSTVTNMRKSYSASDVTFHVLVNEGLIYICAAPPDFGRVKPNGLLDEMQLLFSQGTLSTRTAHAGPLELNREFQQSIHTLLTKYNGGQGGGGATSKLQAQVNEVKGVMSQNIEKVLERGDKLDDLMVTTDRLQDTSLQFHQTSRKVHRRMWWKNLKTNLVIGGIVVVVLIVLIVIILFSTGVLPGSSSDETPATTTATPTPTPSATPATIG